MAKKKKPAKAVTKKPTPSKAVAKAVAKKPTLLTAAQIKKDCPSEVEQWGRQIVGHYKTALRYESKADQQMNSIAQYLAKARAACNDGVFAAFRERFCPDIGRTKIYELLRIGSGKKTVEEAKAESRERKARQRAKDKAEGKSSVTVPDKVKQLILSGKLSNDVAPPAELPAPVGAAELPAPVEARASEPVPPTEAPAPVEETKTPAMLIEAPVMPPVEASTVLPIGWSVGDALTALLRFGRFSLRDLGDETPDALDVLDLIENLQAIHVELKRAAKSKVAKAPIEPAPAEPVPAEPVPAEPVPAECTEKGVTAEPAAPAVKDRMAAARAAKQANKAARDEYKRRLAEIDQREKEAASIRWAASKAALAERYRQIDAKKAEEAKKAEAKPEALVDDGSQKTDDLTIPGFMRREATETAEAESIKAELKPKDEPKPKGEVVPITPQHAPPIWSLRS